ncbi:MAG: hypothetical protein LUP99_02455 [Methanomicrobiales archaeon]|nr:hypothetical protein [Methanomicrobiales archaeon]
MVAPLEHRDTEPLQSIIFSLKDQVEREWNFQETLLWKIRLLEREIQYLREQISSFSNTLEIPREIVHLEKENQTLDTILSGERDRLRSVLTVLEVGDLREKGLSLLEELDRHLNPDLTVQEQETITRILRAYVDTGSRYVERYRTTLMLLSRRIENLEKERELSHHEELRAQRMRELSEKYLRDHPEATYGEFRSHVKRLLGKELEKELKDAIYRVFEE